MVFNFSDLQVKINRAEERKKVFDSESQKECTFVPNTQSPYRNPFREPKEFHASLYGPKRLEKDTLSLVSSLTSAASDAVTS